MKIALLLFTILLSFLTSAQQAKFGHSKACTGTISFYDSSVYDSGQIISWNWKINDSLYSSSQNPQINIAQPGQHSVKLVIQSSDNKKDSVSKTIHLFKTPEIYFYASPEEGCLPMKIQFSTLVNLNGQDTGTKRYWNFGDGNTDSSLAYSNDHYYSNDGSFMPSYTVDNHGCVTSKSVNVIIYPLPDINISRRGDTLFAKGAGNYNHSWRRNQVPLNAFDSFYVVTLPGVYSVYVQNIFGCAALESYSIFGAGIKPIESQIFLYPNPVDGTFKMELSSEAASLRLTDMLGNNYEFTYSYDGEVLYGNISSLPAGIYILQVESNGVISNLKLLKE